METPEDSNKGPIDRISSVNEHLSVEIRPEDETALVWRLDCFFLVVGFLGYAFKYLDQTNISNAYVSGMETDLELYGNEYNYFTTFFNIGYMIMLYPSCIIISHIGPSIWLPACEVLWGILTCCLSTVTSAKQGVCTIFIALLAFIILPGFPERQNPLSKIYLRPQHIKTAIARTRRVGRKPQIGIQVKSFLRCFRFWHLWLFAIAWAIGTGTTPTSYFNLWLKSLKNPDGTAKYSVAMLDYLPIAGQAIQLVAEILFSGFSDYFGVRLPFLLLHAVINIVSLIILTIQPSNEHTYMAGWYMDYVGAVSTMLLCAWASAHLETEPQVRTVLFATGTLFSYLLSAFLPIAAYPASEAPHWRIGAKLYLGLSCLAAVLFVCIHFAFKWEERRKAKTRRVDDWNVTADEDRFSEGTVA
nr:hypothetical protein ANI_1_1378144 [Aspergillus niger CBS 513.88]|eukprot:XP_001397386.2 hypothetical protein ANI_1_1378144 [Aspergillus niger CBS 513.88]